MCVFVCAWVYVCVCVCVYVCVGVGVCLCVYQHMVLLRSQIILHNSSSHDTVVVPLSSLLYNININNWAKDQVGAVRDARACYVSKHLSPGNWAGVQALLRNTSYAIFIQCTLYNIYIVLYILYRVSIHAQYPRINFNQRF